MQFLSFFSGVVTDEQGGETGQEDSKEEKPDEKSSDEKATESESDKPTEEKPEAPKMPEVDAKHPEVIAMVEEALKEAEKQPVTLTPEVYVEILETAIKDAEKEMRDENGEGPLYVNQSFNNLLK